MRAGRSWRACSDLSRSPSPRSTYSAASWSPSACWGCIRRKRSDGFFQAGFSWASPADAIEVRMNADLAALLYLVAGVLFILALRGLSSPETSRRGNLLGMAGMVIAIVTTLASHPPAGVAGWAL